MNQEIVSEAPLSTVDVKEILEKIKAQEGELNFRAQKTYDHLASVVSLKHASAKKLEEALLGLGVSRLREQHVKKLVSVMPSNEKDVKMVMSGFNITLSSEDATKVANAISEHVK